jgi:hypothetical protein
MKHFTDGIHTVEARDLKSARTKIERITKSGAGRIWCCTDEVSEINDRNGRGDRAHDKMMQRFAEDNRRR